MDHKTAYDNDLTQPGVCCGCYLLVSIMPI